MTVQITVRLPDQLVAWIDQEVAEGRATSRTNGIAKVLARAKRRQRSERDLLVMLNASPDPDREAREHWQETREYPEMGEPARLLHPERFEEPNPDISRETG
jgi:Arc/MetJ-type ribon-helix-helix transcriptional regulator